jgi:hypothetical protein
MNRILFVLFAFAAALSPLAAQADDRYDRRYDDRYEDRYDDRYDDRRGGTLVSCNSDGYRERFCRVDTRGGVRLVQQHSRAACVEGSSWGFDRRGIWVDHGCEATFELGRGGGNGGWRGEEVRCGSPRYAYLECPIDTRRGVSIVRQHSSTACIEGRTWGYARRGIWVDRGCDATFATGRR